MDCYIDGIFNYCDRWCERCTFISRCRSFALEKKITKAVKDGNIDNDAFWKIFDSVFEGPIYEESDTGVLDEFDSDESTEDIETLDLDSWEVNRRDNTRTNFVFKAAQYSVPGTDFIVPLYYNDLAFKRKNVYITQAR